MPLKLVPDNTNIGFVRMRYVAFAVTLLLTPLGVDSLPPAAGRWRPGGVRQCPWVRPDLVRAALSAAAPLDRQHEMLQLEMHSPSLHTLHR